MDRFLKSLDEALKAGYESLADNPVILKRTDINSVMSDAGTILNDRRIRESLQTSVELRRAGAMAIGVASHQSRPGKVDFYPLLAHAELLNKILEEEYPDFFSEWEYVFNETCWGLTQFADLTLGRNVLSNNLRFAPWERQTPQNLQELPPVQLIGRLRDAGYKVCYVQDAFSTAHRGSAQKDTSMVMLPDFLKQRGLSVFPSQSFVAEMQKYAKINKRIKASKKVLIALFGGKVKDYLEVIPLYLRRDNTEFLAGSLLSLILLKSQHPNLSFGVNDELFFKDIGPKELKRFSELFDSERIHLASDIIIHPSKKLEILTVSPHLKLDNEVQGIGPQTVQNFINLVSKAQLLIVNGCPFNIHDFKTYGGHFKEFMIRARRNSAVQIYGCGGDAITAIEYSDIKTDISSTAGKLGLLAPMIETTQDLQHFAPAVVPLID